VTREIDGLPQRVVVNELVEKLVEMGPVRRAAFALRNALAFRAATGATLPELLRSALALRRHERLSRSQLLMAANAPILARRAMQEGDPVGGYLPSGSVAGVIDDRPSCAELVAHIADEAERTLKALGA
jgi:NAD(P)H-dependent flavin oxidoreductase YrpB (nitropropane dioxygenase family)